VSQFRFEPEAEALVRQGGFSQSSLQPVGQVIEEYRQQRGLDASTMVVTALLRSGGELALAGT
jgi:hypothetical protein